MRGTHDRGMGASERASEREQNYNATKYTMKRQKVKEWKQNAMVFVRGNGCFVEMKAKKRRESERKKAVGEKPFCRKSQKPFLFINITIVVIITQ